MGGQKKEEKKPEEKSEKIQKMESIYAKMEDILNSQKALMEKAANLQLELLEIADKELEDDFGKIYSNASVNSDLISKVLHDYEMRINVLKQ